MTDAGGTPRTSGGGRARRRTTLGVAAAGVALAAAVWPGPVPASLSGRPRLPLGAPAAWAGDEWCETDPLLLVRTPAGQTVPIYYLTGVQTPANVGNGLLAALSASYTATPAPGGTQVVVSVTVPSGPEGARFPTRLTASAGPWGTLTVYGTATGTAGAPMTVPFHLGVP
jgi:hypothetical protein